MLEVLDAWPVLPVILKSDDVLPSRLPYPKSDQRWDNILAALESEHYHRIRGIEISVRTNSRWERFAAAMQKPLPELTHLQLSASDVVLVLLDSFLGGSAPHLQELRLTKISFPSIPKLLLSANGLVKLSLLDIPDSGYISPDAMATALTVMTELESLQFGFRVPRSLPDPASRSLHPPTRFVLPALFRLEFKGVHEYLEDLLARIDAPLLYYLHIRFFMDLDFNLPQLHRLIGHAEEFKELDRAEVMISGDLTRLALTSKTRAKCEPELPLTLTIIYEELESQLSSLAQICSSSFPLISTLKGLEIWGDEGPPSDWPVVMEGARWLEFLDPFAASSLTNLYLTNDVALHVCSALLELSRERVTEVLPALQKLFIFDEYPSEGSRKAVAIFVAARRCSGHPVSVHHGPWSSGEGEDSEWEDGD